MEEGNVQYVDSPVTVSEYITLHGTYLMLCRFAATFMDNFSTSWNCFG